jgi:RNA polymerase sigma factor (sigma-70 family)
MQPIDDRALLRQYAETGSDAAFAMLVERHINLVYSVALRHVGNPHQAEEITQAVFIILAQKTLSLRHDRALSSWLFQTTRLTAANFVRTETRRHRREQEAQMQSLMEGSSPQTNEVWPHIAPLLDRAVAGLKAPDRQAIVLRYYEHRSLAEVGRAMGTNEDAARMRVNRALEKLRQLLAKRGVNSTTAILEGAMSAHAVQAAPAGLAGAVTAMAVTKGAAAGGSTLTLIKGALKIMAWTKAKTAVVVAVAALTGLSVTTVAVNHWHHPRPATTTYPYPGEWIWEPGYNNLQRVPPLLLLQPTKLPASAAPFEMMGQRYLARGKTLKELLIAIKSQKNSAAKITFPDDLPEDKYDCIVTLSNKWWNALESEINHRFKLVTHFEQQDGGTVMVVTHAP